MNGPAPLTRDVRMSQVPYAKVPSGGTRPQVATQSTAASARLLVIPVAACAFTMLVEPLLAYMSEVGTYANIQAGRIENKIFWPLVAALPLFIAVTNPRQIFNAKLPPAITVLFLYLVLAGLSVLWAFKPLISLTRYVQQILLLAALVIPVLLAPRSADLMRRLYICYAIGAVLNLLFVFEGTQTVSMKMFIGYNGYFSHKNILGEFAAFALFFALFEVTHSSSRRYIGLVVLAISAYVLVMSNSKTSIGLAVAVPALVAVMMILGRLTKLSPTTVLFCLVGAVISVCLIFSISPYDISQRLYGDRTFTNRTEIWDFVLYEVSKKPLFGWGFQSFWLVGLDGPSFTDGQGWIKTMPSAHNGYLEIQLSTGRVGLALMIPYIILTLTAIGRVAKRDPARARLLYSIALFVIFANFLESGWLDGHGFQWPLFVLASVEAARLGRAEAGSRRKTIGPWKPRRHQAVPSHGAQLKRGMA
jgi:exopolysaccharide production protein ExoQ